MLKSALCPIADMIRNGALNSHLTLRKATMGRKAEKIADLPPLPYGAVKLVYDQEGRRFWGGAACSGTDVASTCVMRSAARPSQRGGRTAGDNVVVQKCSSQALTVLG